MLPTGDLSVRELAWSPDGRRIAFTARTDPQRFIVGPVPKTASLVRAA
jgi:Tol biopolymer transport system component